MIGEILRVFRAARWFLLICAGYLLTSIGSGLTQLVVYGELAERGAAPAAFAGAYVLSLAASLLALRAGQWFVVRCNPFAVLAGCELLGLAGVALPWLAIDQGSQALLVASTFIPGAAVGMGVPAYGLLVKRGFADGDFAVVAAIESIGLSANVLLGAGLGALLFPFVDRHTYLAIDAVTYVAAAVFIVGSGRSAIAALRRPDASVLGVARRRTASTYLLIPLVAAFTAPAIALLPASGASIDPVQLAGVPVNAALVLLFARGLSQLVGPALFPHRTIDTLYRHPPRLVMMAAAFAGLYLAAFGTRHLLVASGCILLAHTFAYALTASAQTGMFKEHSEQAIVAVSIRTYQVQLLAVSVCGLAAGFAADVAGPAIGLALMFAGLTAALLVGVAVVRPPWIRRARHP